MDNYTGILLTFGLIVISAVFAMAEIALAASRKIKLTHLAENGDTYASKVLELQQSPGRFFTVVQIILNGVAILGGVIGESGFRHYAVSFYSLFLEPAYAEPVGMVSSFLIVTLLFILFADLIPRRMAMAIPEKVARVIVTPLLFTIKFFYPIIWFINGIADIFFKVFRIPTVRIDQVTSEDIYAVMAAGSEAGVIHQQEHQMIENVFEMQSISVTTAMRPREDIVFLLLTDSEDEIRVKVESDLPPKFLVCDAHLDTIVGYVSTRELLLRIIKGIPLDLYDSKLVHSVLVIPDALTLAETIELLKADRSDFAVVMNEYALVLGVVTAEDLHNAVMGTWAMTEVEEQIVARDETSWLVDGVTPITDVMRTLDIHSFPSSTGYETAAGFMMYMLRKIPRRTDSVEYSGYKFEVVDIDNHKVDQLLVTKLPQAEQ